jgi:hypothetical protein
MKGQRTAPHQCTKCGRMNDATRAADGEGSTPADGDLMLCMGCGGLSIFVVADGVVTGTRELTDDEQSRADADGDVAAARAAVRLHRYVAGYGNR